MVIIKCSRAEVNEADVGALDNAIVAPFLSIVHRYVIGTIEEDVFRFEVCVGQLVVMHETHRMAQLVTDVPHMLDGVAHVVVLLLHNSQHKN